MAESNEVIRYVVEIDTSTAEAKIQQLGEKGEQGAKEASPSQEADNVLDLMKSVQGRVRAGAIAGLAFAQSPGQAMAAGGAVVGGEIGTFIAAIGTLSDRVQSTADELSLFDAGIFEATTGMQFFMMGWKIELAEGVSEVIGDMYVALQGFMIDILPTVIQLFEVLGQILPGTIKALGSLGAGFGTLLGRLNELLGEAAEWAIDQYARFFDVFFPESWSDDPEDRALFDQIRDQRTEEITQGREWTKVLADGIDELNEMIGAFSRARETYDAITRGFEVSRASLTALEHFAYFGAKQGAQLSEATPTVMHAEGGGGGDAEVTQRSFPRPSPAAVNFKVSDQITIQGGDETAVLQEMLLFKQDVLNMINGLNSGQWTRLAEARLGGYAA